MKNAIISWASGYDFCRLPEFNIFLNSIKSSGFEGDVVLFSHDLDDEIHDKFLSMNYKIVMTEKDRVHLVVRDRFLFLYEWLIENGDNYDNIIMTDSKDVLFQKNPSDYFLMRQLCAEGAVFPADLGEEQQISHKELEKYVLLCCEGDVHYKSEWNSQNQVRLQMNVDEFKMPFIHRPIINSGFIAGSPEELKNLCLLMWSNSIRTVTKLSEQATLNYLYFFLEKDPIYKLYHPQDHPFCLTGEGVKQGWVDHVEMKEDGLVYNSELDMPYFAFHQWERTEYKDKIMEKYS